MAAGAPVCPAFLSFLLPRSLSPSKLSCRRSSPSTCPVLGTRSSAVGAPPWPKALSSSARRRAAPRGSAGPFWWHVLVRTGSASGLHVVSVSTSSAVRRSHAFSNSFCSARRCEDPSESLHLFGSNRCSVSTGRVLPTTATPHPHTHTHLGDGHAAPRGPGRTSHRPAGSAVSTGPQLPLLAASPGLLPGQPASRDSGRGCRAGLPA